MARDRKRAKQRRDRRERRSGLGTPPVTNDLAPGERDDSAEDDTLQAPPPLEHASSQVELAEAQLAVGRPEQASAADAEEAYAEEPPAGSSQAARAPQPEGNRVTAFVRGSWRELQRVQWPDRRQVAQATGVVLGFVIIAGAFLGLADLVAGKLVDAIL
jgi:preprotein translocase SecE subunit